MYLHRKSTTAMFSSENLNFYTARSVTRFAVATTVIIVGAIVFYVLAYAVHVFIQSSIYKTTLIKNPNEFSHIEQTCREYADICYIYIGCLMNKCMENGK